MFALCLAAAGALAGSAAASEQQLPTFKVSGKAAFSVEARATGDSYEVRATLSDEVGRPIAAGEIRARVPSESPNAGIRRCGDPATQQAAELLITTDKTGRACVVVSGLPTGSVELTYKDARGYFEPASRAVPLPESVTTSFEIGFDPPVSTVALDRGVQELGLVARARGGAAAPNAAELVLYLVDGENERELGRAALDSLGETHRIAVAPNGFVRPGPARLVARLRGRDGRDFAESSSAVLRTAAVSLQLSPPATVEPGATLRLNVSSALGLVPAGVVEAHSRGISVAAARVQNGLATLVLPPASATQLGSTLTLEYVGPSGWLAGAPLELSIVAHAPGLGRYAIWVAAAALAAIAVLLGWRPPPRSRLPAPKEAPRIRPSVEVLEAFATGTEYRGTVLDAHESTPVSPALVAVLAPGPHRRVFAQVRTGVDGRFQLDGSSFPSGAWVEVTAPFHATLSAPLPGPGLIELSLVSRRRALMERLVRWAERRGKPWTPSTSREPTPADIVTAAANEGEPEVERWARGLERLAFGPSPPDAAAEQASGVAQDPKTTRERGID